MKIWPLICALCQERFHASRGENVLLLFDGVIRDPKFSLDVNTTVRVNKKLFLINVLLCLNEEQNSKRRNATRKEVKLSNEAWLLYYSKESLSMWVFPCWRKLCHYKALSMCRQLFTCSDSCVLSIRTSSDSSRRCWTFCWLSFLDQGTDCLTTLQEQLLLWLCLPLNFVVLGWIHPLLFSFPPTGHHYESAANQELETWPEALAEKPSSVLNLRVTSYDFEFWGYTCFPDRFAILNLTTVTGFR